jgi:hypothetical protein
MFAEHAKKLQTMRTRLVDKIKMDAKSIAGHMFVSNSLTLSDLDAVNEQQSSKAAAEQLIDFVICRPREVFDSFLDALRIHQNQAYMSLAFGIEGNRVCKSYHRITPFFLVSMRVGSH